MKQKHGHTTLTWQSPTYNSWHSMLQRCGNPAATGHKLYGGRGISVCARWYVFADFLADMGVRPDGTTLDRIDNNGHYEPGNCRWATPKQQLDNSTVVRTLTLNNETRCVRDWERHLGLGAGTVSVRLRRGWPLERALTPTKYKGNNQFVTAHT